MQFVLTYGKSPFCVEGDGYSAWTWKLIATAGPIAQSPEDYDSEALARGAIVQFKRSASGVRFAKVVTS